MTLPTTDTLAKVEALLALFEQGGIPTLENHEVRPQLLLGSRENYLYFTLPVSINFQRSSPAMWASALKTFEDPETHYVFLPEVVAQTPIEKVRADLVKHKLALQPNRHIDIWTRIAASLHNFYDDDPRRVLAEADFDTGKLIANLQVMHRARFPYLCGPKLSNYWPFILSHFTDVQFNNAHEISIIPDTHVIKASVHLGLVPVGASSREVEFAWKKLLAGTSITPSRVHPVLWNWSRNKFLPAV